MNGDFKQTNIEGMHAGLVYEEVEVADEQIIYCGSEYEGHSGSVYQVERQNDVPCHVMEDNFSAEAIEAANQDHSVCFFCKEDLSNKRFYNHLFDHHGFTKQQCELMKQQKRLAARGRNARKSLHSCIECGMEFITRSGLNNHLSKKGTPCCQIIEGPEEETPTINNIVCPGYACPEQFSTYLDLAIHVDTFHREYVNKDDAFMIRRKTLVDKAAFTAWKREWEEDTNSEFFLRTSQKVNFAVRTFLYKCLCSNSRGQNKRKCEQCPAFIKVCQRRNGTFDVVACFGHLGHEHPTETPKARDNRIKASRELNLYRNEVRIPQRLRNIRRRNENIIVVDQYKNERHYVNGMEILMPGAAMEEDDEEDDDFEQVIVDDADDDIVGPRHSSHLGAHVYMRSSHHEHHYQDNSHY